MRKFEFGDKQLRKLGGRLRLLRQSRNFSLRSLATESGVSVTTIRELEAGNSSPSLLNVLSLAEVLGEPIDRLIAASVGSSRPVEILRGALPRASAKYNGQMGLLTQPRMRGAILVIPPKSDLPEADRPVDTPIFVYVIDGAVDLTFAEGREERLSTGDAIHVAHEPFKAWANPLGKRAVVLCAVALSVAAENS